MECGRFQNIIKDNQTEIDLKNFKDPVRSFMEKKGVNFPSFPQDTRKSEKLLVPLDSGIRFTSECHNCTQNHASHVTDRDDLPLKKRKL